MINTKQSENFRIIVYGTEKLGYPNLGEFAVRDNTKLFFYPFNTLEKFQDYDGVIMFQNIWSIRKTSSYSGKEYLDNLQDSEFNKRIKQLQLLLEKGGFVCFLMEKLDSKDFDLAKTVLEWFPISYDPISSSTFLKTYRDELKPFIDNYGIAKTRYYCYGEIEYEVLAASQSDNAVGVSILRKIFFLPCHAPDKDKKSTEELFKMIAPGLVALFKKYHQDLPKWVDAYKFNQEAKLIIEKKTIESALEKTSDDLKIYINFKKPLVLSGELLRDSIADVLEEGFGFKIDRNDELKEDLKIISIDRDGNITVKVLIETKGINGNVNRESINQADSHRERGNFNDNFPSILIANTFIKSSNSIKDKDKPIPNEQVTHAKRNNVLILRTVDLIRALDIIMMDKKQLRVFNKYLFKEKGWLEVKDYNFFLH